jgi:hypothetical protein
VDQLSDLARSLCKETEDDAYEEFKELERKAKDQPPPLADNPGAHELQMDWRYDSRRQFYYRMSTAQLADRQLPAEFINRVRNKNFIECQTMALMQKNAKVSASLTIQALAHKARSELRKWRSPPDVSSTVRYVHAKNITRRGYDQRADRTCLSVCLDAS